MPKTRQGFFDSQEAEDIKQQLHQMAVSSLYNTVPSYTASSQFPDHLIPFVDKHMNYLFAHPKVDADMYIHNLQLMTRTR